MSTDAIFLLKNVRGGGGGGDTLVRYRDLVGLQRRSVLRQLLRS